MASTVTIGRMVNSRANRVRIVLLSHGHPELSIGGAESAAYSLFRQLRSDPQVDVRFLAWAPPDSTDDAPTVQPYGEQTDEFLFRAHGFDEFLLSHGAEAATVLSQAIALFEPHVVHLHHYLNIGVELLGTLRRLRPESRLFVTLHEYRAICHFHGLMVKTHGAALCERAEDGACSACFPSITGPAFTRRRMRIRHFLDQADRLVAPSRFLRHRYVEWGIDPRRITVIENGVDVTPVAPPPDTRLDPGAACAVVSENELPCRFGFFGQINPFKGLHCLLAALDIAAAELPEIHLSIHGAHLEANDPSYIELINGLIDRQRARIRFAGPYPPADLGPLMRAVDWVVVPSLWWENSPLVIEEALSHRRPVLCSAIGGMKERIRPGKDGLHFPVADTSALALLMLRVARDRRLWQSLQKTMRTPMTAAESADRHLRLYQGRK
jgi:glycosyltransferase involved in cell wall biosynthesis